MEKKILVATWGYSMVLSTWVKVLKVSPKTLLVVEIHSRNATPEEMKANKLSEPGYLQSYVMPTDDARVRQSEEVAIPFRLYKNKSTEGYHGKPSGMSTTLYFDEWNGKPVHEDHCD